MPRLSDSQFQDYEFRARRDFGNSPTEAGTTEAVVARRHPPGSAGATGMLNETRYEPLGSIDITRSGMDQQEAEQWKINRDAPLVAEAKEHGVMGSIARRQAGWMEHGQTQEPSGQQRWTRGFMEPRKPDRVSWLGMSQEAPKSLLRGMMALGVVTHGSVPVADETLSQYGSSISRGAARKYGVKAHPENPNMDATIHYAENEDGYDLDSTSGEEQARGSASGTWYSSDATLRAEAKGHHPVYDPSRRWQTFTAGQVGDLSKHVEVNMLGRKPGKIDSRVPVHPSQGKLF